MILINLIKVGAIWLTDTINRLIDPFIEARFVQTADLRDLESKFSKHIETFRENGLFLYQKPMPEDRGDHALFQGLYIGYRAMKGNLEGDIWGLPEFFVDGRLIRGRFADGRPNDTTSNDAATGMLFALYCMWQYAGGSQSKELIVKWAQRVVDDGYAICDLSGKPTQYGQLDNGWKTDPLRITLLLALLSLAAQIDRNAFENHYKTLYKKYREILPYPKVKLLWWDTDYDTHRAAIHLHILWQLTRDTIYKDGLLRLHKITRKSSNAWAQVLCSPVLGPEELNLTILNTFSFDARIRGNIATKNSMTVDSVKWGSTVRAKQALPMWRRGSQDFFWQRNMFSLDEWPGNETADTFHTGLDFLVTYWLARRLGLTSQLSGVIL